LDEKHSRANRANAIATELPVLEALKLLISKSRNANFDTCVDMAVETFNSLFRDRIMDLTDRYPADAKTKEGEAFWSGAKRFPAAAKIDINDKLHMDFIISCANIYAANVGLVNSPSKMEYMIPEGHEWRNAGKVGSIVTSMGEKPRKKRSVVIDEAKDDDVSKAEAKTDQSGDGNSLNDDMNDQLNEFQTILNELNETKPLDRPFQPADFEKDQDLNFHIDFITAAANLRARNYRIKEAPKHKCKLIAGKIIPAIATTTAAVTGLVMTEMYKVIQGKGMEAYRDSSNNLGINAYFFSEPAPADQAKDEYDPIMMEEVKCLPAGFTKWDKTEVAIDQGTTLKQFLEIFKKQTGLTCSLLLHSCAETAEEGSKIRGRMLYDSNAWQQKTKELFASKMETPLIDWIKERYAEAELFANPNLRLLPLIPVCADDSGQSFKIPQLVVKWR